MVEFRISARFVLLSLGLILVGISLAMFVDRLIPWELAEPLTLIGVGALYFGVGYWLLLRQR